MKSFMYEYFPMHLLTLLPLQMGQSDSFVTDSHKPWGRSKKKSEKKKTKQKPDTGATSKFGSWNLYRVL